jgi:hypothetical protein
MVLSDFLNLTDAQYASRIKDYSDSQLLEQLKVKNVQVKVGRAVRIPGAIFSFVGGLVGNASDNTVLPMVLGSISKVGGRRVVLSTQKIRLIEGELQRRRLEHSRMEDDVEGPPAYEKAVVRETMDDDSNDAMSEAIHPSFGNHRPSSMTKSPATIKGMKIDHVHTRGGPPLVRQLRSVQGTSHIFFAFQGYAWLLLGIMITLTAIFQLIRF